MIRKMFVMLRLAYDYCCCLTVRLSVHQVFKQPWPGVMRTVYGNHQRFETTYFKKFPGYYVTGDGEATAPPVWGFFPRVFLFSVS